MPTAKCKKSREKTKNFYLKNGIFIYDEKKYQKNIKGIY